MIRLIPVILLLSACTNDFVGACPSALPVTISTARSNYPIDRLRWAANFWNIAAGRGIVQLREGGEIEVFEVTKIEYLDCHNTGGCAAPVVNAWGEITACEIFVRPFGDEMGTAILAHELGHCLGLGHDEDGQSIMYPVVTPGHEVTSYHLDHLSSCQ